MYNSDVVEGEVNSSVYLKIDNVDVLGGKAKRAFDVIFSMFALMCLMPLFILLILTIRISSKGGVFFTHQRIGFRGRLFPCIKFRTMVVDADEKLKALLESDAKAREEFDLFQKLKHDPRIIPGVGIFLRKTSLDELPQLINVIAGQMSIVGPRPVTIEELSKYGRTAADYLRTRPGITGLWQVSGRNNLSFDERVQIDYSYVKNWSISKDFVIILRTIKVMIQKNGAY